MPIRASSQPGGVDGEQAGREPAEAGVLAGADAVLDPGVAAVAQLEQLHRAVAAWGVGDEDLVAHAFDGVEQRSAARRGAGRSRRTIIRVPSG